MQKLYHINHIFVKLTSISLFSKIGDRLFYTALLSNATLLANHSNLAVMLVSFSETFPILLGFILGSFADHQQDKTKHLILTSLLRVIFYLIIWLIFYRLMTMPLLLIVIGLNFCSDLSGNYTTALVTPFTKILVPTEQMDQAQSFLSIGTQLFNVLATFLGSFLLIFISSGHLALINAGIFLIVTLAFKWLAPSLSQIQRNLPSQSEINLIQAIKQNFTTLIKQRTLLFILGQLTLLNGFFGGLTPIFALFIKVNPQLPWISLPLKLALLSSTITLGMILGNLCCQRLFKNTSLAQMAFLADLLALLTGVAFYFSNLYLILSSSLLAAILLGIIAPHFSALIVNTFAITQLGGIVTIVNSCLVIMPPLTSFLFPLLANFNLAYLGLSLYGFLLVLFGLLTKYFR